MANQLKEINAASMAMAYGGIESSNENNGEMANVNINISMWRNHNNENNRKKL
jgi:hypothetical protein